MEPEAEAALERLLTDAHQPAIHPNPMYEGRTLEEIEDDIALVRADLDIEI